LKEENLKAQMIMQVHDELNFNVPFEEIDKVREIVVGEMQNVVHLTVPLIADCGVGNNWLQAH
jgi:DNA polymerase-1